MVSSKLSSFAVFPLLGAKPSYCLALEEFLLKRSTQNFILLWQAESAVIIGKYQSPLLETDPYYLATHAISLFRRFSGGGAVYMDLGNINMSYIGNATDFDFADAVADISMFLYSISVPNYVDSRRSIFMGNYKISGSAQSIYKGRKLFHATLLVDTDIRRLEASLVSAAIPDELEESRAYIPSQKALVSNIKSVDGEAFQTSDIISAYLSRYRDTGLHFLSSEQVKYIARLQEVRQLEKDKYLNEDWTHWGSHYRHKVKI